MGKYQAYPEYKDSGVEWLGEVPKNWNVTRLKFLAKIRNGQDYKSVEAESGYPVMGSGGKFTSASEFMYDKPSVLLGRKGTIDKPLYVEEPFWSVDTMYYTEMLNGFEAKYLFYLALTIQFNRYSTNTALPSMTQEHLGNYYFTVPNSNIEIQRITAFIKHEAAKIDSLIQKQQKLIELLQEKRHAVISHTVTRGLNPDAEMRDSGIEWLGDIPKHWVACRLKHIAKLQSGVAKGSKDLTGKKTIEVPMLRVANVQDGYLKLDEIHKIEIETEQLQRYSLQYGDILMNEGGDNDKLGRGAVWKDEISPCIHQNHVFAIRCELEPEWLDMLTRATYARFYFYRVAKQSTNLASISSSNIRETPVLVPPESERKEILGFLEERLRQFDILEDSSSRQIELLKERRTALISAAVTGKIDVRNWQPPEEVA